MNQRFLCLRLPHWPLQRLVLAQPEWRGQPLALFAPQVRGEPIVALSQAAARLGVRVGQPRIEAQALGKLDVVSQDVPADTAALRELAGECERFSPCVGLEPTPAPAGLLLDVTGIPPLFGGECPLVSAVQRRFVDRGYVVRLALGDTWSEAWALARAPHHAAPSPTLDDLPPHALRLSPHTLAALAALGIETLGQLRALPRSGLAARFGAELLTRIDQAWGAVAEPLTPYRAPPEFAVDRAWEYPLASREAIAPGLHELTAELAAQLQQRGQGVLLLEGRLDCAGGEPVILTVGLCQPSATAPHLQQLLDLPLERVRLPGAVGRMGLRALRTAPLIQQQRELFAGDKRQATLERAALIDRLSSRLGGERVLGARLRYDPQPELAVVLAPLAGGDASPAAGGAKQPRPRKAARAEPAEASTLCRAAPLVRPLYLWPQPEPVAVIAMAPSGAPQQFTWRGQPARIVRHWGPERIETGWWRGPSVRRDYYRVEVASGDRYWLFRACGDGRWFLHGAFA